MNFQKALLTLSLSAKFTEAELKKAYKRAMMKAHPDKGGSIEKSQLINSANFILKSSCIDEEYKNALSSENRAEERELAQSFADELLGKFDIEAYKNYLESFTKTVLTFTESEMKIGSCHEMFKLWKFDDGKSFFEVKVYAQILFPKNAISGVDGAMIEKMSTTTTVLINRKKHKMSQSDWGMKSVKAMFEKPEQTFPAAKLKKIYVERGKVKPVKKADYLTSFKYELNAKIDGKTIRVPMLNGSTIVLERITWMRKGLYQFNAIYSDTTPRARTLVFASFYENSEPKTLDWMIETFKKVQSMTDHEAGLFIEQQSKEQL